MIPASPAEVLLAVTVATSAVQHIADVDQSFALVGWIRLLYSSKLHAPRRFRNLKIKHIYESGAFIWLCGGRISGVAARSSERIGK
jgi:hypothetical protein